ncbi:hypothetical protein DE146DRAFT_784710 [Phaeosphaeria sp. MPI-PUGE-AT-0046c]|nr:hypothetical protein DE146DRAFT_784710 [Phaeosphaeria sp. MPI-PUGE-AT-0046c]
MVSSTRTRKNSSDSNPLATMPPATMEGIIDIKILANIHYYLNQSSLADDLALAAWVKEHYLKEPKNIEGRDIRTAEGFYHLDRAYRRVRSLTNKAQDKWPFFDSNWKKMTSTTVRNNARSADAPGVSLSGMTNATHDSAMSKEQSALKENLQAATPDLSASAALSTRQTRHRTQSSTEYPIDTLTSTPAVKKESKGTILSAVKEELNDSSTTETFMSSLAPKSEPMQSPHLKTAEARSVAASKKRGRNGRYLTCDDDHASNDGEEMKPVKKAKTSHTTTKTLKNGSSALPMVAESVEDTITDTLTAPTSNIRDTSNDSCSSKDDDPSIQDSTHVTMSANLLDKTSKPSSDDLNEDLQSKLPPVTGYEIAWNEPPVLKSNLDRLPPNSLLAKKRKAEATAQDGPRPKRGRTQSSKESSKTPGPDAVPRMSTRRSTRLNAASPAQSTHEEPASPQPSTPSQEETTERLQARNAGGRKQTTSGKPTSPQLSISTQEETTGYPQPPVSVGAIDEIPDTPCSGGSLDEVVNTVASLLHGDEIYAPGLGKVEYLARVHTKKGFVDIPVSFEDLTDDIEIIQKYAVWVQQESHSMGYQDFKSLMGYENKV